MAKTPEDRQLVRALIRHLQDSPLTVLSAEEQDSLLRGTTGPCQHDVLIESYAQPGASPPTRPRGVALWSCRDQLTGLGRYLLASMLRGPGVPNVQHAGR